MACLWQRSRTRSVEIIRRTGANPHRASTAPSTRARSAAAGLSSDTTRVPCLHKCRPHFAMSVRNSAAFSVSTIQSESAEFSAVCGPSAAVQQVALRNPRRQRPRKTSSVWCPVRQNDQLIDKCSIVVERRRFGRNGITNAHGQPSIFRRQDWAFAHRNSIGGAVMENKSRRYG